MDSDGYGETDDKEVALFSSPRWPPRAKREVTHPRSPRQQARVLTRTRACRLGGLFFLLSDDVRHCPGFVGRTALGYFM